MAEFVDVIRQFDRMCKAHAGCINCPLHNPDGVSDECSIGAFVKNTERIEREVMKWAAEHPVVYPTWWEYLQAYSITGVNIPDSAVVYKLKNWEIPADIAEKLGIEPKEGI